MTAADVVRLRNGKPTDTDMFEFERTVPRADVVAGVWRTIEEMASS